MKNKLKTIIPVVVGVVILVGCIYYTVINGTHAISNFKKSSKKTKEDITGVDWLTYTAYDVDLSEGSVSIQKAGIYYLKGTLKNGNITISTNDNVKLVLDNIKVTSKSAPAIYIKKVKNAYIELVGDSKLSSNATTTLDAAIFSKDDLYLFGEGSLTITSNQDGIAGKDDLYFLSGTYNITSDADGIKGKDSITIQDGTFHITAKEDGIKTTNKEEKGTIDIAKGTFDIKVSQDGIQAQNTLTIEDGEFLITSGTSASSNESQKGLKAGSDLVLKKGKFTMNSIDDAIHSNTNVTILDGSYELSTNDDGIHANSTVTIKGGDINITKSYEGIEGYNVNLEGGNIKVVASDDGINICGGNDSSGSNNGRRDMFDADNGGLLTISGGTIYVNAEGDGLDSNGSVKMTGGTVHVDGPTNSGNGALDYNGSFVITGGELIAVGASGMAQNVSSNSTQNTIMVNLETNANGEIMIGDIKYTPSKKYQSIVISSPNLKQNTEYTLKTGSSTQTVMLTSTVSQVGNGGMMGGQPGRRGEMRGGPPGR